MSRMVISAAGRARRTPPVLPIWDRRSLLWTSGTRSLRTKLRFAPRLFTNSAEESWETLFRSANAQAEHDLKRCRKSNMHSVSVRCQIQSEVFSRVDGRTLGSAMFNLILNACQANVCQAAVYMPTI
jgi:hypothetical protein